MWLTKLLDRRMRVYEKKLFKIWIESVTGALDIHLKYSLIWML